MNPRDESRSRPSHEMDSLFIEGLEVPCRVGCTDPERATPQSLRVEVRLFCPSLRDASVSDDLEKTVDYRLAGDLIDAVQGQEYLLIERVAEVLAEVVLRNRLVDHVTVSVKKRPPVQGLEWAGVRITRSRETGP
ncbi:MAG: dihydroneopterin aldolase [Pseudomonadota bacterium]|nr:dihydroneopterin aldolase [Pseudomonadota bacterium]